MAFLLGDRIVDPETRRIKRGSEVIRLSPKAMAVLTALCAAQGRVLGRADLLEAVWPDVTVGEEVLTHAVAEIRKALGDSRKQPRFIETVHKSGYRLLENPAQPSKPPAARQQTVETAPGPESIGGLSNEAPARLSAAPSPDAISQTQILMEGERKQITVLYADVRDSNELVEDIDPEQAHMMLETAIGIMTDVVHRYEGTVNKVFGDGITVLFGAPIAHEDHAVRACYAALAIRDAIDRHFGDVRRRGGGGPQIRIGINSGETVVRALPNDIAIDYNAIGPAMTLAARLAHQAAPGTIRMTRHTLALAEGLVKTQPLEPVLIKGSDSSVDEFLLDGVTQRKTRFQAALARGLTHFVGRNFELDVLERAAAHAQNGQGQIVAIVGDAGVGKSRLLHEFIHSPRADGWTILQCGSVSYGKTAAYLPVVDLIRSYFQIEMRDNDTSVRRKVADGLRALDGDLAPLQVPLLDLLDVPVVDEDWRTLDPPERRRRMLAAVRSLLVRESRANLLMLVFEDLHWVDSETQTFLDILVNSLRAAPILLLVNYRPEYRNEWSSRAYFTHCRIDTFPPDNLNELLTILIGNDISLVPLKQTLIERTDGNPFFLEESVQALVEVGALEGAPGAYAMARDFRYVRIPATVQGVLSARIDRLTNEEKELLQTCAVVGRDVPYALLKVISDISEEALRRCLAKLQSAEFLYESRLIPDLEYTFKHALTQEVAYGSLLQKRRRACHRRIAQALVSLHTDRLKECAETLAHHYTEAGEPRLAVGYWLQAGQYAIERSANPEAIAYLEKGKELLATLSDTPDRSRLELKLQVTLGVPLMAIKGPGSPEVNRTYSRARELCTQTEDANALFPTLWGLWRYNIAQSDFHTAPSLANDLLNLAQSRHDTSTILQAHHAMWATLFDLGEFGQALEHMDQINVLYDRQEHHAQAYLYGGHDPCVCGHGHASLALWSLGYPDKAVETAQKGLALAEDLSHPISQAHALRYALKTHLYRREPDAVEQFAETLVTLATEQNFVDYLATGTFMQGWAQVQKGQCKEGVAALRRGLAAGQASGKGEPEANLLGAFVEIAGRIGAANEGLSMLDRALAASAHGGMTYWDAEFHRLKGELLLAQSAANRSEAEASFIEAIAVAQRQKAKALELRASVGLARLWHDDRKRTEARKLLEPVHGWFKEGLETADLIDAKEMIATLK